MSEYEYATVEKNGVTLTIWQDSNGSNPREWDNLGTMLCGHGRYNLGDKTFDSDNYSDWEEVLKGEVGSLKDLIYLPLYLYDHSGITMSTTKFNDEWDSGQVGWIYVTKEQARKELGKKRLTKELQERIIDILKNEVRTYDLYLTGEIYGYTLEDEENNFEDSCGGFFGDSDIKYMKEHVPEKYHFLFDEILETV